MPSDTESRSDRKISTPEKVVLRKILVSAINEEIKMTHKFVQELSDFGAGLLHALTTGDVLGLGTAAWDLAQAEFTSTPDRYTDILTDIGKEAVKFCVTDERLKESIKVGFKFVGSGVAVILTHAVTAATFGVPALALIMFLDRIDRIDQQEMDDARQRRLQGHLDRIIAERNNRNNRHIERLTFISDLNYQKELAWDARPILNWDSNAKNWIKFFLNDKSQYTNGDSIGLSIFFNAGKASLDCPPGDATLLDYMASLLSKKTAPNDQVTEAEKKEINALKRKRYQVFLDRIPADPRFGCAILNEIGRHTLKQFSNNLNKHNTYSLGVAKIVVKNWHENKYRPTHDFLSGLPIELGGLPDDEYDTGQEHNNVANIMERLNADSKTNSSKQMADRQ